MPAPHRYPMGVQVFERVRQPGVLYVDKTRYVWEMAHSVGSYYFLSRPRRFGKTLLVSTMEAYFRGRRELFEGLWIGEHETEWRRHPVIRLDLSTCKAADRAELYELLALTLSDYEERYGIDAPARSLNARLQNIIKAADASGDESVVVLVDEYDAPLLNVMGDPGLLQEFREVMRSFYAPLKALEERLGFVFITGISKFSQLSIFSELNNLNNISMLPQYAGICGITAEELERDLAPDVAWLGERLGLSPEQTMAELRRRYDGYHFAASSPDVYNPFSLISTLQNEQLGSWWFGSGTPTVLTQALRRFGFDVPELEGIRAQASAFDAPTEAMDTPVPLLYQSGYLTIKGYDRIRDTYTLGVPNAEVSQGLYETLLPAYLGADPIARDTFINRVLDALDVDDIDDALRQLRFFLAGVPYDLAAKNEKQFQAQLFIIFKVLGSRIATEVRTATGRIDVTMETTSTLYVMELKYGGTAEAALAQIGERGYLLPYEAGDHSLVKVGINYSPEERTIEEGWLVERSTA